MATKRHEDFRECCSSRPRAYRRNGENVGASGPLCFLRQSSGAKNSGQKDSRKKHKNFWGYGGRWLRAYRRDGEVVEASEALLPFRGQSEFGVQLR